MRNLIPAALTASLCLVSAGRAGIEPKNFDPTAKLQDDFYQYVNGGWLKANPIPADQTTWGTFNEIDEGNKVNLHKILDRVAAKSATPIEKMVGDFYASGMDEAAINAAGVTLLKPELDRIASLATPAELQAEIAALHRRHIRVCFVFESEPDPKNSSMVIAATGQGGLGLPERDYYLRDDEKSKKIRELYVAHVARLLALGGDSPAAAPAAAAAVLKLETALARGSKKRVELRDPVANYHRLSGAELQKLTPHFDWRGYFMAIGLTPVADLDVGQPEFLQALDAQLAATPVADWQAYLRWHLLHASAPYLSTAFVDENFAFYSKTLTGQEKQRERWKRVLSRVDLSIGEALGQLYVAEYFPPESKARMLKLVGNLQVALRERLKTLEWMDEPTRALALKKLAAFTVKIGYPDKWIDYSPLVIDRGSYVLNVQRASEFDVRRDLAKIGKPVDRTEWGMSPPTVNAYYNPQLNEIVFPAGILQPPFFEAKADDATNYGGIGSVIGHEMTHGFDDEGRQYDAQGNLTDWWTPECAARFKERAQAVVKQFNGYVAIDDLHVNGELTQGENIADLGGIKISYAAFQRALAEQPAPGKIDGFTPTQRFFLSYATIWRDNLRPEFVRLVVQTDPHSPDKFRVNGPLANLDEFAAAFAVPQGAPMRRTAAERVTIW
ncbi:MAG: M13 family peptidase [Opitutaceae bacterium]|nr:M13 family peptidase [Opitutaceae bacterium]